MVQTVTIRTADGHCPVHVFTPGGPGPWPGVVFYMDGFGIRPALCAMAQKLADAGYAVFLPDLYYRAGDYTQLDPAEVFASGGVFETIRHLYETTDNLRAAEDTEALLAHIATRPDVRGSKLGATGYCMGGGMALTAAGRFPDRFAAAASFHGGNLATDSAQSPHLLAPRIEARLYVAGADNDDIYPPEMAERLVRAFDEAGVDHVCEIYLGAAHGWTMGDFPIYDAAAADRAWKALLDLFANTLR